MSKKIIGIIIVSFGALLLAGLLYFLFFQGSDFNKIFDLFKKEEAIVPVKTEENKSPEPIEKNPSAVKKIIINNPASENIAPIENKTSNTQQVSKNELMRMAASFAERFGSYSNQSNFSNIIDLRMFMSSRMRQWADDYVAEHRKKNANNDIYYGITTKAIAREITAFDDYIGRASVKVNTRRREAVNSTDNKEKAFSQDVIINFVMENEAWKVDSANWVD